MSHRSSRHSGETSVHHALHAGGQRRAARHADGRGGQTRPGGYAGECSAFRLQNDNAVRRKRDIDTRKPFGFAGHIERNDLEIPDAHKLSTKDRLALHRTLFSETNEDGLVGLAR